MGCQVWAFGLLVLGGGAGRGRFEYGEGQIPEKRREIIGIDGIVAAVRTPPFFHRDMMGTRSLIEYLSRKESYIPAVAQGFHGTSDGANTPAGFLRQALLGGPDPVGVSAKMAQQGGQNIAHRAGMMIAATDLPDEKGRELFPVEGECGEPESGVHWVRFMANISLFFGQ
jgi:hypothetical protein